MSALSHVAGAAPQSPATSVRSLRKLQAFSAGVAMAAMLACAPAQAQTRQVDFQATMATQEIITLNFSGVCPSKLRGYTTGVGTATVLGSNSWLQTADCIVADLANGTFSFNDGTLTLYNWQGDSIRASYSGTMTPRAGTVYNIHGSYTITGGTGKLRAASGSGTLGGTIDLLTARGQMTAQGPLRY